MKGLYICYTDDIIKKISRTAKIWHDKKELSRTAKILSRSTFFSRTAKYMRRCERIVAYVKRWRK